MDMLEQVTAPPAVEAPELTSERALKDLEGILQSIASSPSHYRNFAVHYMRCRSVLLNGEARAAVPGFLIQCGTSEKFREFITLYDASVEARRAFVDHAFGRCRALFGWTPSYDIFDDEDF
jgi:hypothetical protein